VSDRVAVCASTDLPRPVRELRLDWKAEIAELSFDRPVEVAPAVLVWLVRMSCADAVNFCAIACAVLVGS
jgi:hypothetical protein